jgi:hypothetical protein
MKPWLAPRATVAPTESLCDARGIPMPSIKKKLIYAGSLGLVAIATTLTTVAIASDHHETDTIAMMDLPADIADTYAWHDGERLTLVLTWDGYRLGGDPANWDDGVLYGFHIDTNADNQPDFDIWARFGKKPGAEGETGGDAAPAEWGVKVEGIPGVEEPIIGAVNEVHVDDASGAQVFAGLRDDPFFFDLEGFNDTLMMGTLMFNPARDFAAFKNVHVLVVEFDHAELGASNFGVWTTTGRAQ